MAIEQKWPAVPPRAFSANGTQNGIITIANTKGFKVKQRVVIGANTLPELELQVKRASRTQLIVGPIPTKQGEQNLTVTTDLSAYTVALNAYIYAAEQTKNKIKPEDIIQAVYRQEPGTTIGVEIDDQYGNPIDSVVDNNGINRLAVDGQFHAEVDVQVDVDVDGFYDPVENPDPDNIGLIGHTRNVNPTEVHQVQRITVVQGTENTDVRAMDVSLHDHNGNEFSLDNPFPVRLSGGKILNVYDEVDNVVAGSETLVVSFTPSSISKVYNLQRIEFSGEQISLYRVYVNGINIATLRTHHGSGLSGTFEFIGASQEGPTIVFGDVVELKTLHNRPGTGDFEGRIQICESAGVASNDLLLQEDLGELLTEGLDPLALEN